MFQMHRREDTLAVRILNAVDTAVKLNITFNNEALYKALMSYMKQWCAGVGRTIEEEFESRVLMSAIRMNTRGYEGHERFQKFLTFVLKKAHYRRLKERRLYKEFA